MPSRGPATKRPKLSSVSDNDTANDSDTEDESDSDIEIDDGEGEELLRKFVTNHGQPETNKTNGVEKRDTETACNDKVSPEVNDFMLDDLQKVNEENLRLLEEVQELSDEIREKEKVIEHMKEVMALSVEQIKNLTRKEEEINDLESKNQELTESSKLKDNEIKTLKAELKVVALYSKNINENIDNGVIENKKLIQAKDQEINEWKDKVKRYVVASETKFNASKEKLDIVSTENKNLKDLYKCVAHQFNKKSDKLLTMIKSQEERIRILDSQNPTSHPPPPVSPPSPPMSPPGPPGPPPLGPPGPPGPPTSTKPTPGPPGPPRLPLRGPPGPPIGL